MKKIIVTMIAFAIATATYAQKPAVVTDNEPGWKHIGHTTASFKSQSESIEVLGADEFTALKIKITEAPVHIDRMQVFYESGEMEEVDVRSDVDAGTESRVINLKNPDRDISKVSFTYRTVANSEGKKADIDLYGLKTNQPAGEDAYREDVNDVKDKVEDAAEETEDAVDEAAEDTEREIDDAATEVDTAAHEVEGEIEDAAAEVDTATDETARDLDEASEKVTDHAEEGIEDAAAYIKDTKVKGKVGPGNETVYVDKRGKYYYIGNDGNKVFVTVDQLKDDPDHK